MADTGPYFVFIEKMEKIHFFINKNNEETIITDEIPLSEIENPQTRTISKPIHPMILGKFVFQKMPEYRHCVLGISRLNRLKNRIEFQAASDANKFINEAALVNNDYVAYIPQFFTSKTGIIRNFPVDLDIHDLLNPDFCVSSAKVIKAERLNRLVRPKDGSPSFLSPSTTIKVTFQSQVLPPYLVIHSVRSPIVPFIPKPIFCHKCLRYGHRSLGCRSKARCPACGEDHGVMVCVKQDTPECIHCKGDHLTTDFKNCSEYKAQESIKELMTLKCYSFQEALSVVKHKPFSNALSLVPSPPIVFDQPNFPSLNPNRGFNFSQKRGIETDADKSTPMKKNYRIRYTREPRPLVPKPTPNYSLPRMHINLGNAPLPPNPYRPPTSNYSQPEINEKSVSLMDLDSSNNSKYSNLSRTTHTINYSHSLPGNSSAGEEESV